MKNLKNLSLLLVAVLLVFTSCSDDDDNSEPQYQGEAPSVEKTTIAEGEEIEIEFSSSSNGFSYVITEGSDNVELFEQDDTYYIRGTQAGTAALTLTNNIGTSELTITVGLLPSVETTNVPLNDSILISNTGADGEFSYEITQDGDYIEIVEDGGMQYIVGLNEGTATIVLTTNLGTSEVSITVVLLPSVESTNVLIGDRILISNTGTDGVFSYEITQDDNCIEIVEDGGMQYIVGLKLGAAIVNLTNNFGTSTDTITVTHVYFNGDYYVDYQGIRYNIDLENDTASVAGAPEGTNTGANFDVNFSQVDGILTIPVNIYYEGKKYPVKSIEYNAFSESIGMFPDGNQTIKELHFAEGSVLTTIGESAFEECSGLLSVYLTDCTSLATLEYGAFKSCENLSSVDFTNCKSLATIRSSAFRSSIALSSVDLKDCTSLVTVDNYAFNGCGAVPITLPGDGWRPSNEITKKSTDQTFTK